MSRSPLKWYQSPTAAACARLRAMRDENLLVVDLRAGLSVNAPSGGG